MRAFIAVLGISLASAWPCAADETPRHSIAVMGEAELVTPPDYANVEIGVITQGTAVGATLAENSARMSKVIDAVRALGVADNDIQTSTFNIEPKYQKSDNNDYDPYGMRPIVGYSIANKAMITVTDLGKIAKIVDASIDAGANASGSVQFRVKNLTEKMDKARQAAIENARHKAMVLAAAANLKLGARPLGHRQSIQHELQLAPERQSGGDRGGDGIARARAHHVRRGHADVRGDRRLRHELGLRLGPEIGLDGAVQLDRHGVAVTVEALAGGDADPALAHAIFLDVGLLLAVEADADAAREQRLVVMRAPGIGAEPVGQGVVMRGLNVGRRGPYTIATRP